MHDNLDNNIKHRQPTGDELVDMLNSTRPVGSKAHQDELEKRLLAQLQSNNERFQNMQAVHTGRLISFRKFPAILAATLTVLLIGGTLLIFNLNNNNLFGAPPGSSATPTPVQDGCDAHNLQRAAFEVPVDVYSRDDVDAEIIGTLEADGRVYEFLGANREGDWIVLLWEDNVAGWIHYADLDKDDFIIQSCTRAGATPVELRATVAPPTLQEATSVPTSTPLTIVDSTPLASPPVLRSYVEALDTISVYAQDDEESEVLTTLEEDDIVEVIGQNYYGEWLVIRLEPGYVGWISLEDEDSFTMKEGLLYSDPESGEILEFDGTATPIHSSTPFPPTVPPPDNQ